MKFFKVLAVYLSPKMQRCDAIAPHMSTCGAPTAAQPVSEVHVNTSTALENLLDTCARTASSNSGRRSMWKSNLSRVNEVAQYMSCESSAISTGALGNCGKAERSTLSKRQSNCVVHAGKSKRSACKSSGERSAGGRLRKIATYWVMRSCTPSCQVSMYFFMYRGQASSASSPRFSLSALVNECQHRLSPGGCGAVLPPPPFTKPSVSASSETGNATKPAAVH
jgi:hypothetical protein